MKKWIALFLAATMLLSLTACGSSKSETTTAAQDTTAAESTELTASTEETETIESTEETTEASEASVSSVPVGETLLADFLAAKTENPEMSAEDLANAVMADPAIPFMPMVMPVEAGLLNGFGNAEIDGFDEAAMFAPMIGSIPFVGYIFNLSADTDVDAFVQLLKDNADLRWNICTEADDLVVECVDSTVFFLMCPSTFDAE